ncbi:hypothetical protein [Mucilaginibacter flavus]|uniref:hypothetical protein n=1 Tax=Mucilaginibacter flavus TaxID=931504 RepID=UPI0025B59CA1|nr:hypothetical protein [Mucilaginibacter flavus]MDN3581692.1 hypothetical protein [Mucilaginibacter flavus]
MGIGTLDMTYADLLNDENWKLKRKEIIQRDGSKCQCCQNLNLLVDTNIGILNYSRKNDNGVFFEFYASDKLKGIIHQTIFLKKGSYLFPFKIPNQYIGYVDTNSIDKNWGKVIAIRNRTELKEELPFTIFESGFIEKALTLNKKKSNDYEWRHVPALHVHHTYYQVDLTPWQYPNHSLMTLCWVCHERLHKNALIPFRDKNGEEIAKLTPCLKCHGAGYFPQWRHIEQGICFQCGGAKYQELI